jgi:hypothetical protein
MKHNKKKEELNLYNKYGTCHEGQGVQIAEINDEQVHMDCYLIAGKVMHKYMKGECTLDTIVVVELRKNDTPMNCCKYLLIELFQACWMCMTGISISSMTTFSLPS